MEHDAATSFASCLYTFFLYYNVRQDVLKSKLFIDLLERENEVKKLKAIDSLLIEKEFFWIS